MSDFKKSLEDATEAVKLNSEFAKAYMRKALAERELLLNEESLESVTKALELDGDSEHVKILYEECKSEWDDDHTVSEDNPEKQRFARLEKWLEDGGSKYEKLKIRFYNPIYRGVHAARKIRVCLDLDLLDLNGCFRFFQFIIFHRLGRKFFMFQKIKSSH
jgi:tetratricopeptide (TPR) repeat protein